MFTLSFSDVLTNGDYRHAQVSKRKMSDRSPRKHSERTRKVKSYNEEFSLSETNSNSEEEESNSGDGEWNIASKRRKKDSSSKKKRRSLKNTPEKKSTRPTRSSSNHQTSSYSSLRSSNARWRSPSPEDDSQTRSNELSPLRKRSTRLRNSSTRRPMYSQDDSASGSDSEPSESPCDQNSNSSSKSSYDKNSNSSSKSSYEKNSRSRNSPVERRSSPVARSSRRLLQVSNEESSSRSQPLSSSSQDNEGEDNSEGDSDYDGGDNSEEDYEKPRKTKRNKRASVLPTRFRGENLRKKDVRIQTRNRGQRTVQYQEGDSDEDSENGASRRANSGGLRKFASHLS